MRISEVIAKLEQIRNTHGDLRVEVRNQAGDADEAEGVSLVRLSSHPLNPMWRAFVDC